MSLVFEKFVRFPGVAEVRWMSDDPDFYRAPKDLHTIQNYGIPDHYGKKDKKTTEQSFFFCNVCECELKSIVTLRAHCKVSKS